MTAKWPGLRLIGYSVLIAMALTGCEPIMRDLQYGNVRSGLFPSHMDLTNRKAKVDAAKLMKSQTYEGEVQVGDVTVHYPRGLATQAKTVGQAFDQAREEVKARTGITWAFDLDLYLVPVTDISQGYRLSFLLKGRKLSLPILVAPGGIIHPEWSHGIAHEITEASLLAPLVRRDLVLGDYCWDGFALVNETRWFRDGVSDFAGDIVNEKLFGERYQPPGWINQELANDRERLLDWDNCEAGWGYPAAHALVIRLNDRFGKDVIARIMAEASQERYINGRKLNKSVGKVIGEDLKGFVKGYEVAWLGMDLQDTRPFPEFGWLVREGNQVKVTKVYSRSPAWFWKLRPGDILLSADDKPIVSAAWLTHYLAAHQPGDRVLIEFERSGERHTYRMQLAAR